MNESLNEQKDIKNFSNPFKSKTFKDFSFVCGVWVILLIIIRIFGIGLSNIASLSLLFIPLAPTILLVIFVYHNIEHRKKKK